MNKSFINVSQQPCNEREEREHKIEWYSRGYLPHRDKIGLLQSITFRLADSLPKKVLGAHASRMHNEEEKSSKYRIMIEKYLDQGLGSCLLHKPQNAKIIVNALKFFDNERYDLIAYVVMPNHVHLLVRIYEAWSLSKIIHSWKSYTAKEILKVEKNAGGTPALPVWQKEYWDRYIRDENHFNTVIEYIHNNPVKAGLCKTQEEWRWSSGSARVPRAK